MLISSQASTTRILLRKGRGDERVAKIQDSPGKPRNRVMDRRLADNRTDCAEDEATYIITTGGIDDPVNAK